MREAAGMDAPGQPTAGGFRSAPAKQGSQRRDRSSDGLARNVLARLPLAVAVINAGMVLSFWNEQAGLLFGAPPLMAAERPALADILTRISHLTQAQRARIISFVTAHMVKGDRTEPDGCLRLSLARGWRIAIQVHGLGSGRWMLILDDGKVTAAGSPSAQAVGDAWLDSLTGLANRRHFNDMLRDALEHATAETCQAIMLVDLDGFAAVNQTFGQPVGDGLLCLVAQRLRREIRDDDLLARLGGDEFALLLPNGAGAEPLAARIIAGLAQSFLVEGQRVTISASIGMVRFPDHGTTADNLMRHAHVALHQAKAAGGRVARLFDPSIEDEARTQRDQEIDLRRALALGEITLAYRPCGDIASRSVTGFEARLHWNHSSRGAVPEAEFAQLVESTGFIVALGEWALKKACLDATTWLAPLAVAMRISERQLSDPDRLTESVRLAVQASGLAPGRLQLKIAEAALQGPETQILSTLHRLRALGVGIVLVDFDIGPALLDRVRSLPFQGLAFELDNPADIAADAAKSAILRTLAAAGFAHIGCYFSGLLSSTPGIADVVRHQTTTRKLTAAAE